MRLSWHGTAALTLEKDGFVLAVDPFVGMPAGVPDEERRRSPRAELLRKADAVLVTHGHFDHIYDIPALYHDKEIAVYVTATPCATLLKNGVPASALRLITPGDKLQIGPFTVRVWQGRHCRFDLGVIKQTVLKRATLCHPGRLMRLLRIHSRYDENGETAFFEITADGRRVQLMGSMGLDDDTVYPVGADLLILPFQGTSDPSATVQPIIRRLMPKKILLDHYDDAFPPMSSQVATDGFVVRTNGQGIWCEAMQYDKIYRIGEEHE